MLVQKITILKKLINNISPKRGKPISIISQKKVYDDYPIKVRSHEKLLAQYNQVCLPLGYSLFYLECEFDPQLIPVKDTIKFKIIERDLYGYKISLPLYDLYDDITIRLTYDGKVFEEYESYK